MWKCGRVKEKEGRSRESDLTEEGRKEGRKKGRKEGETYPIFWYLFNGVMVYCL